MKQDFAKLLVGMPKGTTVSFNIPVSDEMLAGQPSVEQPQAQPEAAPEAEVVAPAAEPPKGCPEFGLPYNPQTQVGYNERDPKCASVCQVSTECAAKAKAAST